MNANDCFNCPNGGNDDCPWLTEVRRRFTKAVDALDPYRGATTKDDHGRCQECQNTGWTETRDSQSRVDELVPCRCPKGRDVAEGNDA